MLYVLSDEFSTDKIVDAISICKSNSQKTGAELRHAHIDLGFALGKYFKNHFTKDSIIIALVRAGIPIALGFADCLDCAVTFYDDKTDKDFFEKNRLLFLNKEVIFIDAVINSGKGILRAIEKSEIPKDKIKIVTNVLCEKSVEKFNGYDLFTVRVSNNSFVGQKVLTQKNGVGPDTGDRLFNTLANFI